MSPRKSFAVGAVVGSIVVLLCCSLFHVARIAALKILFDSSVERPIEIVLSDITKTANTGSTELAIQKLRLLERLWREYQDGGDSPEQFMFKITELRSD
jgi:hypothetical protein